MTENHNHRPRRYPSLVWPVILISAGVLFLLDNLNVLNVDLWNLWRLWPILLILAGIDIIFGRRSALGNILVLVFTLVVVGGVIVVLLTSPDTLGPSSEAGRVETILERVDGVERADLEVNFGAGRLNIDALDDSSSLIQGRLDTGSRRHPVWEINRSGERATMTLEYPSSTMPFRITGWNEGDDWDLHLAPKVGYSLDVNMGAGEAELDLSDLNIRDLTLESGANSGPFSIEHTGHEFVMCLRGQLEYQVENNVYKLEAGDTLLFAAQLKHRWRNTGKTVTNAIFVLSGYEEKELPIEAHFRSDDESDST